MITAKATPRSAYDGGDPLYVEVSPLLGKHLAGIGRFAARLIEALARQTTLRLVNTIQGDHARNMRLSKVLRCGQQSAALCDKLVANSYSTKADADWLCRVAPENIVVCYPGPTLCVHEHASPEPVARRGDVLLVVSTLEPRKNGPFLFHWFLNTPVL